MMAGLDGIRNEIEPGIPLDGDLFELSAAELADWPQVPSSLEEALVALEGDNEFLLAGGVFTSDLIETWIELKRRSEADEVLMRPHPWEFALYYQG
jgi:glutamine synthetase